ncbi:F-box protein, partial [Estrella lausannensis]|uniref:F-box protein n=1 Tax=Estrella lausannensis TaxID=483423 RepID=UPI00117AEAA8
MQFNLISPIYQGETKHPYEKVGFLRGATHFFNFGQDAYQIEYLNGMSNLVPESLADHGTSWTGSALKAAALSAVAISLFKVAKALSNRYFESKGSMSPELPRDIHVLTAKYLSTKDLLAMRLVSRELKAVAELELIDRLNRGTLSPGDLQLNSLPSLIDYFGERATLITRLRYEEFREEFDVTLLSQFSRLRELGLKGYQGNNLGFLASCPHLT